MASFAIDSVRSALNALDKSDSFVHSTGLVTADNLKNLELFLLCARKFGDDSQLRFYDDKVSTLGSLFQRIHELTYNWGLKLTDNWDEKILENFIVAIDNFNEEIGGWYSTLLDSLLQPTSDEVMDIIDAVLENVSCDNSIIEAMIKKITFLRHFIRFATLWSVKPRQLLDNLLIHIRAVAIDAAHMSYICFSKDKWELYSVVELYRYHGKPYSYVELNVPVLLQMIKMVDRQVDEIYTQVLTSSKLSTQLHPPIPNKDHDPLVIMKDFIDSLLWNLWERLHMDTPIVISTNSELQLVYKGLRLLRSMLKDQPNKFDKKFEELTRVVICDAGIIIFSLYQKDMEMVVSTSGLLQRINRITQLVKGKDFSILDLLQRISRIRRRVEGKDLSIPDLQRSIHNARERVGGNELPRTNELGFVDFLLENLVEMTSSEVCYGFQSRFRMIHDELSLLRYSLGKIEGLRNEQKDLEALWNAGVKVAYRVEFLIDQLVFEDFQSSSFTSFDSTAEDILKEVKSINSNIHPAPDLKLKKVVMTPDPVPSQNRAPVTDEIVGFDDDIKSIMDRLTRGSKQLKMVAIVGMPGIGKTTLATKVFNHPSVTFHFHVRLWCCVSQSFHKKNLLLELLNLVGANTNIATSEQDLTEKLWRHLKGERYLIFLDDIWDIEAWDSLKTSFPDDCNESRILVTSRHRDAVPQAMLDEEHHFLHLLSEDQSWELLRKKLPSRNDWSLAYYELGKQIAANCEGLPLTVVVVAGLLANTEPQDWKIFLESIKSVSGANHCMNTLELSYKHLPGHLKQCFLYFGLFPEDHGVSVKSLIQLWIAEGFVLKTESKNLEDVARGYVMDLAGRSLVIVSKKRSRGGVKACRIHDLLHDFCRTKAKEENFFQLLKGYDELLSFEEPDYMRRLCVHSEKKHFNNLRLFSPHLHSLLYFAHDKDRGHQRDISFIIPRHSCLRVLDIGQYPLSLWIPSEIGLVLQLKYLSLRGDISAIPSSIGNLANMETLIIFHSSSEWVSVPDTFWNLQKLRHVAIKGGFRLAFENLEKFPDLCELQSCSNVIIHDGDSIERLLRKFPNIRKLCCELDWEDSNEIEVLIPNYLSQLESLSLTSWKSWHGPQLDYRFEFDFPVNLRKLSLTKFLLHQSDVARIEKLPNLQVLKFLEVDFHENTWDMVKGKFSTLKFLELTDSKIARWTASDDQFSCLQKLVLERCYSLEEIPCCFESCYTLEMVEVKRCCEYVESFFKGIEDEQTELGNSLPKIHISKIGSFSDNE